MSLTLSAIYIYPVKSCAGIALTAAQLNDWGLKFDRNWLVVTSTGRFLTQREVPKLALVETAIDAEKLHLSAPGQTKLSVPLSEYSGETIPVEIWRDRCEAVDQGEAAGSWFSHFLEQECRLVRIGNRYDRPIEPNYGAQGQVSFADAYPLLLISEASLADLNQRLPESLPMDRFRPNLVVSGCDPYAEDTWQQIQIHQTCFDIVKPCTRCVITTTDQTTGTRAGAEPLKTLATYRKVKNGVIFGQNLVHQSNGDIQVGAKVEILQKR
jgi:uncharacterized protein